MSRKSTMVVAGVVAGTAAGAGAYLAHRRRRTSDNDVGVGAGLDTGVHEHRHGQDCGHTAIRHGRHVDYVHDGELHRQGDRTRAHGIEVSAANPDGCSHGHDCDQHATGHMHGPGCGHDAIRHGGEVDYLVGGHLHHQHEDHCDEHGPVALAV